MKKYTQTELARKCNVSEGTIRKRRDDFNKYISPTRTETNVYYTQYDFYKMAFIQWLLNSSTLSDSQISDEIDQFCSDIETLELLSKIINKHK